jgi:hypothetical protein
VDVELPENIDVTLSRVLHLSELTASIKDAKRLISAGAVKIKFNSVKWDWVTGHSPSSAGILKPAI